MNSWDVALFRLINGFVGRVAFLDSLARLLVNDYFLTTLMGLSLVVLWFEGRSNQERENNQIGVLHTMLSIGLASILLKLCNWYYYRLRPFAALDDVNMLFYPPSDSSLPSNPATIGFSMAVGVWLWNRRLGAVVGLLAALFGLARIYSGVHYPGDILAGALLGGGSSLLVYGAVALLKPLFRLAIGVVRLFALA